MTGSDTESPVLVLLPTYNGAAFLSCQLDSLFSQQHRRLLVLCRDDASSDATPDIIDDYAQREPDRLRVVRDDEGNLGACRSFSRLMEIACRDYPEASRFALADQDDIWHPQRLSRGLAVLGEQESLFPGRAVIVHSDLHVVSEQGELLADSMAEYQGLRPQRPGFAPQLLFNSVTGCTVLMNRALLEAALPVPEQAVMHDWWLSLFASAFGQRCYINEPLVDYRQHDGNTIGAKRREKSRSGYRFMTRLLDRSNQEIFEQTAAQAAAFRQRYADRLSWKARTILRLTERLGTVPPPIQKLLYRGLRRL